MSGEQYTIHRAGIAEVTEGAIFRSVEEILDLLGNVYFQGSDSVVMYENNLPADFFDLKNGMAGDILQKFSTYRIRLVIVGDFEKYPGRSVRDFIRESNAGRQVNFLATRDEALKALL